LKFDKIAKKKNSFAKKREVVQMFDFPTGVFHEVGVRGGLTKVHGTIMDEQSVIYNQTHQVY